MYVLDKCKLQEEMIKRNWTPKDLAEKLNANVSTIYDYFKADKRIRYDTVIKLKDLFGADSGVYKQES